MNSNPRSLHNQRALPKNVIAKQLAPFAFTRIEYLIPTLVGIYRVRQPRARAKKNPERWKESATTRSLSPTYLVERARGRAATLPLDKIYVWKYPGALAIYGRRVEALRMCGISREQLRAQPAALRASWKNLFRTWWCEVLLVPSRRAETRSLPLLILSPSGLFCEPKYFLARERYIGPPRLLLRWRDFFWRELESSLENPIVREWRILRRNICDFFSISYIVFGCFYTECL